MDNYAENQPKEQPDLHKTVTLNERIMQGILQGMSDGVILVGLDGKVLYANPAVAAILDREPEKLNGKILASLFYEYSENDQFNQTLLNAIIDPEQEQYDTVPYYTGSKFKQLHVLTSVLSVDDQRQGTIMLITDITELASLKIRYAQQITTLLDSLVKAFSTAIDERSHYTANHTRNMVKMGESFLGWLDQSDAQKKIAKDRRRAFLMSVWLHDVGKLTIPLEIMDKATRLGEHMGEIEIRLDRIHLLDRIAMLEGRMTKEEYEDKEAKRGQMADEIRRIDRAGFLSDEDLAYIASLEELTYEEEDGSLQKFLTEEEVECLKIRKGTLTDEERTQMQDHVVLTKKILDKVEFPEAYAKVPLWASMHHEFINGSGYPDHRKKEEIPVEVRLLTILDIFEALTAKDRPYKKPFAPERAFQILHGMASDGYLDPDILGLFEQSRAWEGI